MGCGCGGSVNRRERVAPEPGQKVRTAQTRHERRRGGPGEPGYAWTGPAKPKSESE